MPKLTVNVVALDGGAVPGTVVSVRPFWQTDPARSGQGIVTGEKTYLADGIDFTLTEGVSSAVFEIPSSVEIAGLYDVEISTGAAWTNVFMPDGDTVFNRGLIVDAAPLFTITAESTAGGHPSLTQDEVDARVAAGVRAWARAGSTQTIPDNVIPSGIARDSEVSSAVNTAVTSASVALGGRIDALGSRVDDIAASGGLTQDQVDARIDAGVADWAETNNAATIPLSKIGTEIARDDELHTINRVLGERIGTNADSISELQREVPAVSAGVVDANSQRVLGDDLQSVTVASASSYQATLNSQVGSSRPLLLVVNANISGTRGGVAYSYSRGEVLFFAPLSDSPEFLFTLPEGGGDVDLSAYRTSALQDIIDGRHTSGILLARREASTADGKAVAAQEDTDRLETVVTTNTGNITTNSNLIAAVTGTVQSLVTEVDTLHPKIGRLVPITPWVRNNEARTLRFAWFPLDAVSTSDTLRMSIGGVAHTPRVTEGYAATDVSGIVLAVPVSAANSATITRESNTTAGYVRVDLVMARANFHCYVPSELPAATAPKSNVVRAATATASTDRSVTLPTDYATYKYLLIMAEDGSVVASLESPTTLLTARATVNFFLSDSSGRGQAVSWTSSSRTLTAQRLLSYVELHD